MSNRLNTRVAEALSRIRAEKPLIHHITNLVVMSDTANVTLHVGALPVMAYAAEEVTEMTRQAAALLLNTGTPTPARVEAMVIAGREANRVDIPIVLDPVGAGTTSLRRQTQARLLEELQIAIVRGNAGEIGALSGTGGAVRGVESVEALHDPVDAAWNLARRHRVTVALSGKRDIVSDGQRVLGVDNGHLWLTAVSGTGCMASSVIAAFASVERDYLVAAAGGLACFGLAAELAAPMANGPASFKVALLDQIYHLQAEQLAEGARIVELIGIA
jgi:hydroxyethylthiazole kinase